MTSCVPCNYTGPQLQHAYRGSANCLCSSCRQVIGNGVTIISAQHSQAGGSAIIVCQRSAQSCPHAQKSTTRLRVRAPPGRTRGDRYSVTIQGQLACTKGLTVSGQDASFTSSSAPQLLTPTAVQELPLVHFTMSMVQGANLQEAASTE